MTGTRRLPRVRDEKPRRLSVRTILLGLIAAVVIADGVMALELPPANAVPPVSYTTPAPSVGTIVLPPVAAPSATRALYTPRWTPPPVRTIPKPSKAVSVPPVASVTPKPSPIVPTPTVTTPPPPPPPPSPTDSSS